MNKTIVYRSFFVFLFVLLLGGCGGGVSSDSSPGTTTRSADLSSTVDVAGKTVQLSWNDVFPSGTVYQIEMEGAEGTFSVVDAIPGTGNASQKLSWSHALTGAVTYRVSVVQNGQTVLLLTSQGASTVSASVPASPPAIVANSPDPLSGTVVLSVNGSQTPYVSVAWYVDLNFVGNGAAAPGNPYSWLTTGVTDGSHLVLARVETSPGNFLELRRSFTVANNAGLVVTTTYSGTSGIINFDTRASAPTGIAQVAGFLDGVSLGVLSAPNACSLTCHGVNDLYRFTVDSTRLSTGSHTFLATATDGTGATKNVATPITISNPPLLTVDTPADGAFVYGTLQLKGGALTDKPGGVQVSATLGSYPILQSSSQLFSTAFDLTGVPPGTYTLTVNASDQTNMRSTLQRTVVVASDPSRVYQPLFDFGIYGTLFAIEGDQVVYQTRSGPMMLRNVVTNTEVVLQKSTLGASPSGVTLENGNVYASTSLLNDCQVNSVCVYQWRPDGSIVNLSTNNPYAGSDYQGDPVAHGNYVVWSNVRGDVGSYTLYNVQQSTYAQIPAPSGVSSVVNTNYDFAVTGNTIDFAFWAAIGSSVPSQNFDLFHWSSITQSSTNLTNGTQNPATLDTLLGIDGQRVVWQQNPLVTTPQTYSLVGQPFSGGPRVTFSTQSSGFMARDGIVAWQEKATNSTAIKVATPTSTVTIANAQGAALFGTAGGYVYYVLGNAIYRWNSATGNAVLILDTIPGWRFFKGNMFYFTINNTVYRIVAS
ncbi:hypothetical protein [Burkholderia lata]|uniref:Lipoprotein n=1 Tax=Burkholderia lata (strain ATCC 17760 / DSM 23089 / LMG 22485 / NCIMB 9086 / R18194 / 383) TaxID=482957 RepID=A0A6P2N587_BURL3|nr:hypothetical protein [Burkholderia lata]VWB88532.1 hypothetical protein BLA6863_04216 [Burkholderia lata]